MACKHGDNYCGTHWTCGKCRQERRRKANARLTPEQHAYDDYVDPLGAYHDLPHDRQCSCHINPPCSACVAKEADDE